MNRPHVLAVFVFIFYLMIVVPSSEFVCRQMIAILLGLIFLNQNYDQDGALNMQSVLFLLLTNMTFNNVFGVVNVRL